MRKSVLVTALVAVSACVALYAQDSPQDAPRHATASPRVGHVCSVFLDDNAAFSGTLRAVTEDWVCVEIDWGIVGDDRHVAKTWFPRERVRMLVEADIVGSKNVTDTVNESSVR
ncbi:MAG: hypothetical protein ABGZ53_27640 [Fuerstiella sp.]